MDTVITAIETLFTAYKSAKADRIEKLPQSGGDRIYFRIYYQSETFIATYNLHEKETQTFIAFSTHFKKLGLPVPAIFCVNDAQTIYLQEDLGTNSLLNELEQYGHGEKLYGLFKKSLHSLADMQIKGDAGLDLSLIHI